MDVKSNHRLLFVLYLFGLQTVHNNSREIIEELKSEFGQKRNDYDQFDTQKLFGLYRSRESHVIFKDDPQELRIY
jgi:hypothetical protein